MKAKSGIALAMAAGFVATSAANATDDRQAQNGMRAMKSMPVGHIYYNPATGERVVTPFENRPRAASGALWLNNNTDPCATGGTVGVIDDPDLNSDGLGDLFGGACVGGTFPCEGTWNNFWGDIAYDSVVDCLVVAYGITAPDFDADSDSIGDGIVGYDMTMTFSDNDNGFGADFLGISGRSCILDLTIPTLAGSAGALPPGFVAVYILTLDFASVAPSLVFELGDSDGVDDAGTGISGGALYGPGNGFPNVSSGIDWDSNGLADFSFAMRFDQSTLGTTGAPGVSKGVNGFVAAAPKLGNAGDLPADPADAAGLFDATDIYSTGPQCTGASLGSPLYIGTFFFGGFTCAPGAEVPHSSAWIELYGPDGVTTGCGDIPAGSCNAADLAAPVGTLDFSDVIAFLTAFGGTTCGADIADPIGTWDFSDVIAFLTAFGGGCP